MYPQTGWKENERTFAGINAGPHIIQQRLSRRLMLEVTWPPIPEPLDPLLETRRLAWRWWCNRVGSTTWNGSLEPIGEVASPTHISLDLQTESDLTWRSGHLQADGSRKQNPYCNPQQQQLIRSRHRLMPGLGCI